LRAPALFARGLSHENQQNDRAAISDYTAAIALAPGLVSGYVFRAYANERLKRYDDTIADMTTAIAIKPFETRLYALRGITYQETGRYAEAESDFASVVGYYPNDSFEVLRVGLMQWAQGHVDAAIASFDRARGLSPNDPYYALWREIARSASGRGEATLASDARNFDKDKWPAPVTDLYLEKINAEDVLTAATKGDEKELPGQKCEAQFYVAEWHLLRRDGVDVQPLLVSAAGMCPDDFVERVAAKVELSRLRRGAAR
jgi:lipoprotein NlpI